MKLCRTQVAKYGRAVCVLVPLLLISGIGNAALIDQGDITVDTSTGLQWLDLDASQSRSFDDVATQFGTGGDYEGFRYATILEVIVFWSNAGVSDISVPPGSLAATESNFEPIAALMELTGGDLGLCGTIGGENDNPCSIGLAVGSEGGVETVFAIDFELEVGLADAGFGEFIPEREEPKTGSWLVAIGTVSVREPTGPALIMLSIAALLLGRVMPRY